MRGRDCDNYKDKIHLDTLSYGTEGYAMRKWDYIDPAKRDERRELGLVSQQAVS